MYKYKFLLLISLLAFMPPAFAQRFRDLPKDTVRWVTPSVEGDRPSKAITISYALHDGTQINTESLTPELNDSSGSLKSISEFELKVRAPISWRGRTRVIFGLGYRYEEFTFDSQESLTYDFYSNLQEKHLKTLNGTFYITHALPKRRFLLSRLGAEVNGDYKSTRIPIRQQSKISAALVYGWKPNIYTAYGLGVYYSYSYGRPSIYPAFLWNRSFNERWGIEGVLPANLRLRYGFSDRMLLIGGYEVEGASYHIESENPPLRNYPRLELRNSRLKTFLEWEREIYDFLWIQLAAGYRFNVSFNVSENNSFSNDKILKNELNPLPFARVMLFVVPPRKLTARLLNPSEVPAGSK
jgi:hypothetical protein